MAIKKREIVNKNSVFVRYFLTNAVLVLLSCAIIGSSVFWYSVREFRNSVIESYHARMTAAMRDFEEQFDAMYKTALTIAITYQFQPSTFTNNKYYEIELLDQLKQYTLSSLLSNSYFLVYNGNKSIFQSSGYVNLSDKYFTDVLQMPSGQPYRAMIDAALIPTIIAPNTGDNILFVFPIKMISGYKASTKAALCYVVTRKAVENRLDVIGGWSGEVKKLSYDASVLFDKHLEGNDTLSSVSDDGRVSIELSISTENIYTGLRTFSLTILIICILLFIVCLTLASFTAYRNYMPIRDLANRFHRDDGITKTSSNELLQINESLDALANREILTEKQMHEQLFVLREQLFRLLVHGRDVSKIQNRLVFIGVKLDAPLFRVLLYALTESSAISDENRASNLLMLIEDLSSDEFHLYPFIENDATIVIITSLYENSNTADIKEYIGSLLNAEELGYRSATGDTCDSINDIYQSYNSAQMVLQTWDHKSASNTIIIRSKRSASEAIDDVIKYIDAHYADYSISLDSLANEFGVSITSLSREIKQKLGVSYHDYLVRLRFDYAKILLVEQNMSVQKVCQKVGYTNISHFIKIFSSITGETPAKYKANARSMSAR
ncbi:hypothetical protein FACS1894184_04400 [Clostridia bacterium]|nr:hypothetical protein FACS1894184_04400 [Clostridia bacterium]